MRLPQDRTIALDTMVFIYHFEAHPLFSPVTTKIFEQIETGKTKAVTSRYSISLHYLATHVLLLHHP